MMLSLGRKKLWLLQPCNNWNDAKCFGVLKGRSGRWGGGCEWLIDLIHVS